MKRRDFLKSMAAAAGWLLTGGVTGWPGMATAAKNGYYHIVLLSDLHLPWRTKKFPTDTDQSEVWEQKQQVLENINSWEDVDEVAILGDLAARFGTEEEFVYVDDYLSCIHVPWYAVAGNHDYAYEDEPNEDGKLQRAPLVSKRAKLAAFTKRYHLPDVFYARSVGRYRLLYLAPDGMGHHVELSAAQLAWMEQEIAGHQEGPMLFFCHAPLMGTLRNYKEKINTPDTTAQPADALSRILSRCPQGSLWLSGHTHTPPKNDSFADDSVNRFNANLVNIHNPTLDKRHVYTNSLYLYGSRVLVRTFDHTRGKWVDDLERVYESP